ncbi:hypothetical protein, partial [Endozoicomonas sp. SESOKO1]|uniref:hypothetical protein n=1 Tax=Endozoicomonas sp. SESOKO1 TaxID=2828742 RepID=UPI0021497DB3
MKATAPTYSHREPAGWVGQQAGSSRIPDCAGMAFSRKRVSNHQHRRGKAHSLNGGKGIEDAFWQQKTVQGRQIASAGVLNAYGNDGTSLRSGFFLQKLCLQNVLHVNRKVTPDQVIKEFNRAPDRHGKYKLAIARFKEECCLRDLVLDGRKVTPDAVVNDFRSARAMLELAR